MSYAINNKLFALWLISSLFIANFVCAPANAQTVTDPEKLLKGAISETLADIDKDKTIISDKNKLIAIVDNRVLPLFNMTRITAKTVGRDWLSATDAQKKSLEKSFTELLVHTYTNALLGKKNVDTKVGITWGRAVVDDKKAEIQSIISIADTKVSFNYVLRYEKETWKIEDLVLENLSVFSAYKDQFSSIIKNGGGIDGLIKKLDEDVAKLKV